MLNFRFIKIWNIFVEIAIMAFCFYTTLFIFFNSYEILTDKDLRFVSALRAVNIEKVTESVIDIESERRGAINSKQEFIGNFGKPEILKVPRANVRLSLIPAIKGENGKWLARSNNGHFLVTSSGPNNYIGNTVAYAVKNWRTISNPEAINEDDNIFLDTKDGWRYMFRISERQVMTNNTKYVMETSPETSLLFIVNDLDYNIVYVFKADFINIQNIQL